MKANKMMYLNIEVIEFLRNKPNASRIVNDMLLEYMEKESLEGMSLEELKREKKARVLIENAKKEAQKIRNGH